MQASGSRSNDYLEKAFKQELGVDSTSYISKDPMALALFFKDEGIKFYKKREYDVAMIYFSKAIECDSLNKVFYSNRAACHFSRGNFKLALKDSLKSIEIDPTYMTGYYRGAISYLEMNKVDSALELISLYREKCPEKQEKEDNQETSQDENKNPEGERRRQGSNTNSLLSSYNSQNIDILYQNIVKRKMEHEVMNQKFPSFKKFLVFNNWLYNGECHFPKLELKFYSDSHRGVVAKSDIEKDEIILKVPKEMLISIELAKTTQIGEKIASFMYIELNSPKHCLLTSFLLGEIIKGEESSWKDYLYILPKNYSSFPIFFTEEELSLLDGSPFKQQVIEKKQDILKDYEKICYYIPEFADYDYKLFCETRMAVSSRIFGVKIDFKKTDVIAPFADLLNHKRPRSTHWYYDEKYKSFIIQALEDIPKFSEVIKF
jgi:histone-lysine N-methyltransferase SETD3